MVKNTEYIAKNKEHLVKKYRIQEKYSIHCQNIGRMVRHLYKI